GGIVLFGRVSGRNDERIRWRLEVDPASRCARCAATLSAPVGGAERTDATVGGRTGPPVARAPTRRPVFADPPTDRRIPGRQPPNRGPGLESAAPPRGSGGLFGGHPGVAIGGAEGVQEGVHIAVEDGVEVMCLVADAVVGDAVLREVVGADPFRTVDGADLTRPALGRFLLGLLFGEGLQPRGQN